MTALLSNTQKHDWRKPRWTQTENQELTHEHRFHIPCVAYLYSHCHGSRWGKPMWRRSAWRSENQYLDSADTSLTKVTMCSSLLPGPGCHLTLWMWRRTDEKGASSCIISAPWTWLASIAPLPSTTDHQSWLLDRSVATPQGPLGSNTSNTTKIAAMSSAPVESQTGHLIPDAQTWCPHQKIRLVPETCTFSPPAQVLPTSISWLQTPRILPGMDPPPRYQEQATCMGGSENEADGVTSTLESTDASSRISEAASLAVPPNSHRNDRKSLAVPTPWHEFPPGDRNVLKDSNKQNIFKIMSKWRSVWAHRLQHKFGAFFMCLGRSKRSPFIRVNLLRCLFLDSKVSSLTSHLPTHFPTHKNCYSSPWTWFPDLSTPATQPVL